MKTLLMTILLLLSPELMKPASSAQPDTSAAFSPLGRDAAAVLKPQTSITISKNSTIRAQAFNRANVHSNLQGGIQSIYGQLRWARTLTPAANVEVGIMRMNQRTKTLEIIHSGVTDQSGYIKLQYPNPTGRRYLEFMKPAPPEDQKQAQGHFELGLKHSWSGEYDEAILEYQKALGLHPNYYQSHYNLALAYSRKGMYGSAAHHLERYLEIAPGDENAPRAEEVLEKLKLEFQGRLGRIEKRLLEETDYGRTISAVLESQEVEQLPDDSLPTDGYYSLAEDRIYYRIIPLDLQEEKLIEDGQPVRLLREFHEKLHRLQIKFSKWNPFLEFFRKNGHIKRITPRYSVSTKLEFGYSGDIDQLFDFSHNVLGLEARTLDQLLPALKAYSEEFNSWMSRMTILFEMQAYLACYVPSFDDLYAEFQRDKANYPKVAQVDRETFERIFVAMNRLYGYYHSDHEEVARFIAGVDSPYEFLTRVEELLSGVERHDLRLMVEDFVDKKTEFHNLALQLARESLVRPEE